ncbi:hypothetical protein [Reinekea sp. G2M2-21]|jgi:hypothetical protein|uniref:hypothetical protein n=1 Tax=Reinekea sp. G2M2-21 TaxID=2788942 RepID=UPI0018A9B682|nr:hypothetical protein [Reinekea sp. G2M2-21]MDX1343922.1 hypothetical protein [Reinekea sp.]
MEWIWFVVAIVGITTLGDLGKKWLALKAKDTKPDTAQDQRIRQLEERVATLERIATDEKTHLKNTIDAL